MDLRGRDEIWISIMIFDSASSVPDGRMGAGAHIVMGRAVHLNSIDGLVRDGFSHPVPSAQPCTPITLQQSLCHVYTGRREGL